MADVKNIKGVSERDRKMLEQAEAMLGADPSELGVVRSYYFGRVRSDLMRPYPDITSPDERERCDRLLGELERYLRDEHPAVRIDQEQEVPDWVFRRLFDIGVFRLTIPEQYGGLGMGITSYNRVLEMIGRYCGSTAVIASAHQSIGCKAVMLYGTDEQKAAWLPRLATEALSAFCLSEPNVGCDAGGQETRCELSADGSHYILNGEKKWATNGALSALFTVMARQTMADGKDRVTALVCTPDMPGVEIFSRNRSKCSIRGTWQARIRLTDVKVPRWHLLGEEGRGLQIALTCLNYGRCTLSAGMLGGAHTATEQATAWARTRVQFARPIGEFEQVRQMVARMQAYTYAMDAMLYMTTGFLDRGDEDVRVETAICKVFCSEYGWRVVNDAVQVMGGEGLMTENGIERIFRDSRLNLIGEGANEVMQQFIFGWGGRPMAEAMLGIQEAAKRNPLSPKMLSMAIPAATEVILGIRRRPRPMEGLHHSLSRDADRLARQISELSYQVKRQGMKLGGRMISAQCVQARLADAVMFIHAWACCLSKLDRQLREHEAGRTPAGFERDRAVARHFFDMAEMEIAARFAQLRSNADASLHDAAAAAMAHNAQQPVDAFIYPERSELHDRGRRPVNDGVQQFGGGTAVDKLRRSDDAGPHSNGRPSTTADPRSSGLSVG